MRAEEGAKCEDRTIAFDAAGKFYVHSDELTVYDLTPSLERFNRIRNGFCRFA